MLQVTAQRETFKERSRPKEGRKKKERPIVKISQKLRSSRGFSPPSLLCPTFQAQSSGRSCLTALSNPKLPKDENLTNVTCCFHRSLSFRSYESFRNSCFNFSIITTNHISIPLTTFTYLKFCAQITRWHRSSCLSTVLSVYLLLEPQGRPNLHNSLPAADTKDDSAVTWTPERGKVLHDDFCTSKLRISITELIHIPNTRY